MQILSKVSHRFSKFNRQRKLRFILNFIDSNRISICLIVGAIPRKNENYWENIVESGLLNRLGPGVTFSGLDVDGGLWPIWVQADGRNLPFDDKSFDLVVSNAVIEHVGMEDDQRLFTAEHARVGKKWIITTPNRFFPIESHTQIFFKHMARRWSNETVTRLLSKGDLRTILPEEAKIRGNFFAPTFLAHN